MEKERTRGGWSKVPRCNRRPRTTNSNWQRVARPTRITYRVLFPTGILHSSNIQYTCFHSAGTDKRQPTRFYARGHVHLSSSLTLSITYSQSIQSAAAYNITSVNCETEWTRQSRQSTPEGGTLRRSHARCHWPAQRGYHTLPGQGHMGGGPSLM